MRLRCLYYSNLRWPVKRLVTSFGALTGCQGPIPRTVLVPAATWVRPAFECRASCTGATKLHSVPTVPVFQYSDQHMCNYDKRSSSTRFRGGDSLDQEKHQITHKRCPQWEKGGCGSALVRPPLFFMQLYRGGISFEWLVQRCIANTAPSTGWHQCPLNH
jgi:hypothetical protein